MIPEKHAEFIGNFAPVLIPDQPGHSVLSELLNLTAKLAPITPDIYNPIRVV